MSRRPAPTRAARVRAAALANGEEYAVAQPAQTVDWSSLRYEDGEPIEFVAPLMTKMPELGYGVFRHGVVRGPAGTPVVPEDTLLIDAVNVNLNAAFRRYSRPAKLFDAVELTGEIINLASMFSVNNYGHALLDGMGRLGLLQAAGYDFTRASWVIMPGFASVGFHQTMALAGFSPESLIVPTKGAHYRCEQLVQTTFPGRPRAYSGAISRFFRSLDVPQAGRGRRLLVTRKGGKRTATNDDQLDGLADEFGLEIYEARNSPFSPSDFAAAELVVGAHGAGLSDIAFCAPSTNVIEILPSGHRYPYFATLASASGLNYVAVRGKSVTDQPNANFVADVPALRRAIEAADRRRQTL